MPTTWSFFASRAFGGGHTNCIEFHPTNPNYGLAGTDVSGLFQTSDGGQNWVPRNSYVTVIDYRCVACVKWNPDQVTYPGHCYALVGEGTDNTGNLIFSTDYGVTWSLSVSAPASNNTPVAHGNNPGSGLPNPQPRSTGTLIAVDTTSGSFVYVASFRRGVYRASIPLVAGSTTWQRVGGVTSTNGFGAATFYYGRSLTLGTDTSGNPDPGVLYYSEHTGTTGGAGNVWRTTNPTAASQTVTWTEMTGSAAQNAEELLPVADALFATRSSASPSGTNNGVYKLSLAKTSASFSAFSTSLSGGPGASDQVYSVDGYLQPFRIQSTTNNSGSAENTTATATWPAQTKRGSLLLACVSARANAIGGPVLTAPSGWTATTAQGATGGNLNDPVTQWFYALNADPRSGAESFSLTGGDASWVVSMFEYHCRAQAVFDTSAGSYSGSGTTTGDAGTAVAAAANELVLSAITNKNDTKTQSGIAGTFSQLVQQATSNATAGRGVNQAVYESTSNSAGGTLHATVTLSGNQPVSGSTIAVQVPTVTASTYLMVTTINPASKKAVWLGVSNDVFATTGSWGNPTASWPSNVSSDMNEGVGAVDTFPGYTWSPTASGVNKFLLGASHIGARPWIDRTNPWNVISAGRQMHTNAALSLDTSQVWYPRMRGMLQLSARDCIADPNSATRFYEAVLDLGLIVYGDRGASPVQIVPSGRGSGMSDGFCITADPYSTPTTIYVAFGDGNNTNTSACEIWSIRDPLNASGSYLETKIKAANQPTAATGSCAPSGMIVTKASGGEKFLVAGLQTAGVWRYSLTSNAWEAARTTSTVPAAGSLAENLLSTGSGAGVYRSVFTQQLNSTVVYCFDRGSGVWRSTNAGGGTWVRIHRSNANNEAMGFIASYPTGTTGNSLLCSRTVFPRQLSNASFCAEDAALSTSFTTGLVNPSACGIAPDGTMYCWDTLGGPPHLMVGATSMSTSSAWVDVTQQLGKDIAFRPNQLTLASDGVGMTATRGDNSVWFQPNSDTVPSSGGINEAQRLGIQIGIGL